jgi:hypothetical protein
MRTAISFGDLSSQPWNGHLWADLNNADVEPKFGDFGVYSDSVYPPATVGGSLVYSGNGGLTLTTGEYNNEELTLWSYDIEAGL